jgi:AcrR family transcriptional regulator
MESKRKQLSKEKILSKAARLFAKDGFEGVSMSHIAERVGMEKASLYYHFKDKHELFDAVSESVWKNLNGQMQKYCNGSTLAGKKPGEILEFFINHVLVTGLKSGLAMLNIDRFYKGEQRQKIGPACHIQDIRNMLEGFLKDYKVRQPNLATEVIMNSVFAYVARAQFRHPESTPRVYAKYLTQLFF